MRPRVASAPVLSDECSPGLTDVDWLVRVVTVRDTWPIEPSGVTPAAAYGSQTSAQCPPLTPPTAAPQGVALLAGQPYGVPAGGHLRGAARAGLLR